MILGRLRFVGKEMTSQDAAQILGKCFLFGALDDGARRELVARVHRRSFNVGDPIFHAGEPGQSMMVVLSGTVRVSLSGPRGKSVILADLSAGEPLGEVALLDGKERSADAVALTKCDLLVLERREVVAFLEKRPDLCLKLLELVCARLRKSDARMSDIAFFELSSRLAKVLLERVGKPGRTGVKPKLSLSQTELASMINASRENVNRCLRNWQRQGIVDVSERWITVLQRDVLQAIVESP
jgi:CRP/FNR family cyclic AMP-dependent transcriptional regulator